MSLGHDTDARQYELAQVLAAYAIRKADADEDHGTAARLATASRTHAHDLGLREAAGRAAGRALTRLKHGQHDRAAVARAMRHRLPTLMAFMRRAERAHAAVVERIAAEGIAMPAPPNLYSAYALITHAVCHDLSAPDYAWLARVRPRAVHNSEITNGASLSWASVTPHDVALVHLPDREATAAKELIRSATELERALANMGGQRVALLRASLTLSSVRAAARFLDQQPAMTALAFETLVGMGVARGTGACGAIGGRVRFENARINAALEASEAAGPGRADLMTADGALDVLAPDSPAIASAKELKDVHVRARRAARLVRDMQGRLATALGVPDSDLAARQHAVQIAYLVVAYLRQDRAVATERLAASIGWHAGRDDTVRVLFDPEEFHEDSPLWAVVNAHATRLFNKFRGRVELAGVFKELLRMFKEWFIASPWRFGAMSVAIRALAQVMHNPPPLPSTTRELVQQMALIAGIQAALLLVGWALLEALVRLARAAGLTIEFEPLDEEFKAALEALAEGTAAVRKSGDDYARALDDRFRSTNVTSALSRRGARLEAARPRHAEGGAGRKGKAGGKAGGKGEGGGDDEAESKRTQHRTSKATDRDRDRDLFSHAVARLATSLEALSSVRHFGGLKKS
jgi:hypothetical protein